MTDISNEPINGESLLDEPLPINDEPIVDQSLPIDRQPVNKHIIKHIVLSGGGVTGLSFYGALRQAAVDGFWKLENIQSIYGTSAGSMIGVMIALNYDWSIIDEYIIKRPWEPVFNFNMYAIFDAYQNRGMLNIDVVKNIFLPLFNGKDISIDITMREFYEWNHIEFHLFTTDINAFELVDISYKTHPEWKLIDAIYCSCAIPLIFPPLIIGDRCYIDGGLLLNYPLSRCIADGCLPEEILGIRKGNSLADSSTTIVTSSSTLVDYLMVIIKKVTEKLSLNNAYIDIPHQLFIRAEHVTPYNIYTMAKSAEEREQYIQFGSECWSGSKGTKGSLTIPPYLG